jgi:hypothetical protein
MRTSGWRPQASACRYWGDADLAAGDDAGVVRHVLRLERRNANAAPGEAAPERRRQQALAGETRRALDR